MSVRTPCLGTQSAGCGEIRITPPLNKTPLHTYTIRTSWITLHHFILQELIISVIISPPITPNKFWGFNKRNSQEKLHHPISSLLGKVDSLVHQNILREFIGVINFTSVTPEDSWGINCVVLEGPMVIAIARSPYKAPEPRNPKSAF